MKRSTYNKLLGLSLGDRSLLIAEVSHGEKASVRKLAEFIYPVGTSLAEPAALGKALGEFLRTQGFSTKAAAMGIPAKWLAVKSKDVPPADADTLADILRLQAEGEFSSELKDLVFDFAGGGSNVLLVATPRKHVDAAIALCEAAGLSAVAVTPAVVALGSATARAVSQNALVLSVSDSGSEFSAQHDLLPVAVRTLRSPTTGELRRALTGVTMNGTPRELVVWDGTNIATPSLGREMGLAVRTGELSTLNIDASTAAASATRKYAPAVAVALEASGDRTLAIDFLHSRLAETKKPLVPRWAIIAAVAAVVFIAASVFAYRDLQNNRSALAADTARVKSMQADVTAADAFVSKVSFAQNWHVTDARYMACLRDLTAALPDDSQTYATNLLVREKTQMVKGSLTPTGLLSGTMSGRTSDPQRVQMLLESIKKSPGFLDVTSGGTRDVGMGREVSFSIAFTYRPAGASIAASPTTKGAAKP